MSLARATQLMLGAAAAAACFSFSFSRPSDVANAVAGVFDVASFVCFVAWTVQSRRRVGALYPTRAFVVGVKGTVLWWLVPFANLYMPLTALREVAQHAEAAATKVPSPSAPAFFTPWWVLFTFGGFVGLLADASKSDALRAAAIVVTLTTTALSIAVVRKLDGWLRATLKR